jgi:putative ABC transport system permease protein
MLKDYIKIAIGNLTHRKLRSWLTMLGIFIGIAAVISLISLGQGLENLVISQFNVAGTNVLTVQASGTQDGPPGSGAVNKLTRKELEKIQQVSGVDVAVGRLVRTVTIEYNNIQSFGYSASIPDGKQRKALEDTLNLKTVSGRLLRDGDKNVVMLGNDFYNGGRQQKVFNKEIVPGSKVMLNGKSFVVVGFLEKKGSFTVDSMVLFNEQDMRDTMNISKDEFDIIAVRVKDIQQISKVKQDIERILRKERNEKVGEEDFIVQTPEAALKNLKSTLFAVQLFVYIIAGISIIVGGIGIMNTMYTAVLERTKEIGIMKSIGATNKVIFTLFFIESGFLGMAGGIIGILLGVGIAELFAFAGRTILNSDLLSTYYSPFIFIGALLFAFIIGTLAGILPALQAARTHPVDALNYTK